MISVQKKFLFVHIPKTGGNSIQNYLQHFSEDEITVNEEQDGIGRFGVRNNVYKTVKHSKLRRYKSALPRDLYASLYKFATIRNSWDRVVSAFFSPAKKRKISPRGVSRKHPAKGPFTRLSERVASRTLALDLPHRLAALGLPRRLLDSI